MKERPILFSAPMVRAIISGRKTQTRRVMKCRGKDMPADVKSVHQDGGGNWVPSTFDGPKAADFIKRAYPNGGGLPCPYGKQGDHLWVRETFLQAVGGYTDVNGEWNGVWHRHVKYCADGIEPGYHNIGPLPGTYQFVTRPSIFMPRWASRFALEITDVRVERVQEISEADARSEGIAKIPDAPGYQVEGSGKFLTARDAFRALWDSINGKRPGCDWRSNPFVWVVKFKVVFP